MTDRLIICCRCDAEIQHNTPLEHGGTGLPVPGLCEDCAARDREDSEHVLEIVSLGMYPAALCSCKAWGYTATHAHGDTQQIKQEAIEAAHRRHVEGTE